MTQQTAMALLGRSRSVTERFRPSPPPARNTPPEAPRLSNPLLAFLDRVFLWLPGEQSPGAPAIAVALARQAVLPFVIGFGPAIFAMALGVHVIQLLHSSEGKSWSSGFLACVTFGCIATVQELNRYAFVRRAERPIVSLAIITAVEIIFGFIFNHQRLYTMSWGAGEQLLASLALYLGLNYRSYIGLVIAAIVIGHTAVDVTAPRFFRPATTESARTSNATPDPAAPLSAVPPTVGGMQTWAKIYPGATVISVRSNTVMNLTGWKVIYTAPVSPDKIDAFYQDKARAGGFSPSQSFGDLHMFRQAATNNDFSYAVTSDPAGSAVIFNARAFGAGG